MNSPDARLVQIFETGDVYQQKLAGGIPLAARFFLAEANMERARRNAGEEANERLRNEAAILNARLRETARLKQVNEEFRHTRVPMILSAGRSPGMVSGLDVPVGMDEGMVRLASVAGRIFAHVDLENADFEFDKEAGIGTMFSTAGNAIKAFGTGASKAVGTFGKTFNKIRTGGSGVAGVSGFGASLGGALSNAKNTFSSQFRGAFNKLQTNTANRAANTAAQATRTKSLANASPELRQRFEQSQVAKGLNPAQAPQKSVGTAQGPNPQQAAQARAQGQARAAAMTPEQKQQARLNRSMQRKGVQPAGPYAKPDAPTEPTGGNLQGPKPPPSAQPTGQVQSPAQAPAQQQPAQQTPPPQGQVQPPRAPPQPPPQPPQGQPQQQATGQIQAPQATAQNPTATTSDKPGFLQRAKLTDDEGNLDWDKVKNTAVGLGAAGLGAYGLYRAGKGVLNMLGREDEPDRYNANSAHPAGGVNEYGYADKSVAFQ